ncbi:MAG: transposase [bacterium]|nr:transposase [bacterium]
MLGKRDPQDGLFDASTVFGEDLDAFGFHGLVALHGRSIFKDEDFASLYCEDNGRPSVPPSLLALAMILQHHDGVSDDEVIKRCRFDLRWKAALHLPAYELSSPFAKSTMQGFRARLVLHDRDCVIFERSVMVARERGLLPETVLLSLDSSPVIGRGAVRDTYNLLSDAIAQVLRGVAREHQREASDVAADADLARHIDAPSIKGSADIDWTSDEERGAFLDSLIIDCRKAIALAAETGCGTEAASLIERIIEQDVDEDPDGGPPKVRRGVAKERISSTTDPESRHGRKSSGQNYTGHKAHVAVTETGVVTHVDVTAPSTPEGSTVSEAVNKSREVSGSAVQQVLGDSAYSTAPAQAEASAAEVELRTKMPRQNRKYFAAGDFTVSEDGQEATCPAGASSHNLRRSNGDLTHVWSPKVCGACPLKAQCTKAAQRSLRVRSDFHDRRRRERWSRSPEGREALRKRQVVEHALGRMKHRGAGRARYFGRRKTRLQWRVVAAVVNLSLAWNAETKKEAA